MSDKPPVEKQLTVYERISITIFLVLTLGSFVMMIISFFSEKDSKIWEIMLASLISMMAGFLYGVNRTK